MALIKKLSSTIHYSFIPEDILPLQLIKLKKLVMEKQRCIDREAELKAFDETKAGVKGLVDAGVRKLPPIFLLPAAESSRRHAPPPRHLQIPVIDMAISHQSLSGRRMIVEEIRSASATWGFFQVVNHGFPKEIMQGMIDGVRRFFELPNEEKIGYYSRDYERKMKYVSNFQLYHARTVCWRDTLLFSMAPVAPDPSEFPPVCRDIGIKYAAQVKGLALEILKLLSEALGLKSDYLIDNMECARGINIQSHYYPPCPEPDRAQGTNPHKDPSFITILMQDHIGGLQVLHRDHWIDVPSIPGAFVINIGDLLKLISNDKFKSSVHRVLANKTGPRISVASFLSTPFDGSRRLYGPIKELLSDENPPLYREIKLSEYPLHLSSKDIDEAIAILDRFRL